MCLTKCFCDLSGFILPSEFKCCQISSQTMCFMFTVFYFGNGNKWEVYSNSGFMLRIKVYSLWYHAKCNVENC